MNDLERMVFAAAFTLEIRRAQPAGEAAKTAAGAVLSLYDARQFLAPSPADRPDPLENVARYFLRDRDGARDARITELLEANSRLVRERNDAVARADGWLRETERFESELGEFERPVSVDDATTHPIREHLTAAWSWGQFHALEDAVCELRAKGEPQAVEVVQALLDKAKAALG
jgi:hypothetical protein